MALPPPHVLAEFEPCTVRKGGSVQPAVLEYSRMQALQGLRPSQQDAPQPQTVAR